MTKTNYFDAKETSSELRRRYNLHFIDVLAKNGARCYLFGGALRDIVMGKDWKDADIRVWMPLSPEERDRKVEALLKEANIDVKSVTPFGPAFTVFRFLPPDSSSSVGIDLSVVSEQWLVGPDFTINGLYFDIETEELIDQFKAVESIQDKIIKSARPPLEQFKDEPYMLFRAVKSACQFGFEIEKDTLQAMKDFSGMTEGVLTMTAEKTMPAFTEWLLGNMWRGLKYDPRRFESLWRSSGFLTVFRNFLAKRLSLPADDKIIPEIFLSSKKYGYEEAISLFLSAVARSLDEENAKDIFEKTIEMLSITGKKNYEDFLIEDSSIHYH